MVREGKSVRTAGVDTPGVRLDPAIHEARSTE